MPTAALLAVFLAEITAGGHWAQERVTFLAAQIEVESAWRPKAESPYALGLAQFTPATWGDIAPATTPPCIEYPITDPACSIRAQILYMKRLTSALRRTEQPMLFAASAYNGGLGWVRREQRLCSTLPGCNPNQWESLERVCLRAQWACKENKAYPSKILARVDHYTDLTTSGRSAAW